MQYILPLILMAKINNYDIVCEFVENIRLWSFCQYLIELIFEL